MGEDKKYTSEDIIEAEKIHRDNYKQIYDLVIEVRNECENFDIVERLNKALKVIKAKELICEKDIELEQKEVSKKDTSK